MADDERRCTVCGREAKHHLLASVRVKCETRGGWGDYEKPAAARRDMGGDRG